MERNALMKSFVVAIAVVLAFSSRAYAQQPTADESHGYVAFVGQSAFGKVTSQSFGLEAGWNLNPRLTIFAEIGHVRDTAHEDIGPAAQLIAVYLGQVQPAAVGYSVKQPVSFAQVGAKYNLPYGNHNLHPYVLVAGGGASVKRDVRFTIGNTDVTETLNTYGVVLGTDLAGTVNKGMVSAGAGVTWRPSGPWMIDLGYRYSHILTEAPATNVNRIGLGLGVTF